jgi:hypothetical protein
MHIRITARALMPGGGLAEVGSIHDLPEAEAAPMIEAGLAEPWPPAAEAAEPSPPSDPPAG